MLKHINLKFNQDFFSFQFAALDYTNPQKNQYAYYLEGLEDDWNYSGNRRFANYTGVPPGNYTFRVKGSNNDGYWNQEGASIAITILPPPWKTWWAYTIYGIFLIGLIYAWRKYDLKRQRLKQELKLGHVEAEKLKELDTMKSRFFANISHEFRTPLTLILGPLQNLLSQSKDEKSKQYLNMMQRNARRLQNLINQLLNLSKLESGKMKLQAREENIVVLVNGYVQSFESLAKQKNIDLIFHSNEENIPLYVDKDKIEKILFNLLSNAFKFTNAGGAITIQVGKQADGIFVSITDTGHGILPEKLNYIFDRFYQADDSYSKDQEGTGIGLALAKELAKLHHGTISVESHIGEGSVFTVFLPAGKHHLKPDEIIDKPEMPAKREKIQEPVPEHEFSENTLAGEDLPKPDEFNEKDDKPYVLIVDDNADLRSYMRDCLTEDYYIHEATEGVEGFSKATQQIPDLIISDVMMPKMDGYELCKKLKTDERTSHIPVILLTARASSESRIEGLETGADDFITKPFDYHELLTRIKNLIQLRNKLKEKFRKEIDYNRLSKERDVISMDQQFIRKAKAVVEKNISEPEFSIENFAREMALSRVQLHRKLRALVDQSATQFIKTIKLNRAAELLKNKSGTVSEIAYDVGFNTLPYFTKCFQEQFGVNPSEFAK
jgi:signal transduction histidine kinase/DNA-binding response OmpR family regulator